MSSALLQLVVQQLEAQPRIKAQGVRVLVQPPYRLPFPYILLGPIQSQNYAASGMVGQSHQLHIAIWTRDTPYAVLAQYQEAVEQVMQALPASQGAMWVGGAHLMLGDMRHDAGAQIMSWHGDYRIRTMQVKG